MTRALQLDGLAGRLFGVLSRGERQQVMVAWVLVQEPELLVLDEPTNHLDIRHQLENLRLIEQLDLTILTSLHDLSMAAQKREFMLSNSAFAGPDAMKNDQLVTPEYAEPTPE